MSFQGAFISTEIFVLRALSQDIVGILVWHRGQLASVVKSLGRWKRTVSLFLIYSGFVVLCS